MAIYYTQQSSNFIIIGNVSVTGHGKKMKVENSDLWSCVIEWQRHNSGIGGMADNIQTDFLQIVSLQQERRTVCYQNKVMKEKVVKNLICVLVILSHLISVLASNMTQINQVWF